MTDLRAILEAAIARGAAPGFSAAAIRPGGEHDVAQAGAAIVGGGPVTADTLFWIASCTKAVTSVALLQLVERAGLDLDAPVGPLLPVLATPRILTGFDSAGAPTTRPAAKAITARHLLTHTSGLSYDFNSPELTAYLTATGANLVGAMDPDMPLLFEPGEGWVYGTGIDWAGRLLEAVTGQALDAYVADNIFAPLGMTETTFFPDAEHAAREAAVHARLPDGAFTPIPFGMPNTRHFMMGGAGLYSTAVDYLKFLGALASGGAPLLKPETFALMMSSQATQANVGALTSANPSMSLDVTLLPDITKHWGLAGAINQEPVSGGRAAGSLAWAGLANCYFWADPATGAAGVLLAQLLPFGDPGIIETFDAMERAVYA